MPDNPTLVLKQLGPREILFRNFAGAPREFNSEGDRNFCVKLDPEHAKQLKEKGWRVKQLKPREEGEEGDWILKVKVNFKTGRPPKCMLKTSSKTTVLDEDNVKFLDAVDVERVDVVINGWWSDMAEGGYSGFLKTIALTAAEDEVEAMYMADLTENFEDDAEPAEA